MSLMQSIKGMFKSSAVIHGHHRPQYTAYHEIITQPSGKYLIRIYGYEKGSGVLETMEGQAANEQAAKEQAAKLAARVMNKYRRAA